MDFAAFSPRKSLQLLNQSSPRTSARKRSLFPSNSPQSSDLGLISELCSDDSDVYSPPLASPASSTTPTKDTDSQIKFKIDNVASFLKFSERSQNSPRKSSRKSDVDKENIGVLSLSTRKSPKKSFRYPFLENENFDDHFEAIMSSEHTDKQEIPIKFDEMKSSNYFTTPAKKTSVVNNFGVRRSPRSASKQEVTIKPNSFYGNLAPILATNQTNRIQGMKCVFRPPNRSRAKAKLLFEEKPAKKRNRSKSADVIREAKRRKTIFTGVRHAIPKPVKKSPSPEINEIEKRETIREKARKLTDLSRTPYGTKKKQEGWEFTLRFTKPLRYEESPNMGPKRKFFKTSVRESPTLSSNSSVDVASPFIPKKRKLLDTRKDYLQGNVSGMAQINASDISALIEDYEDKLQDKPEVDDILLRLEEEDEEEKKKETEREILMNILEDSPVKMNTIDSLSNCTASLDLNDSLSPGSGCSRFSLEDTKENQTPPHRMYSVFNGSSSKTLTDVTNQGSSSKKKWHGVGWNQLQIDAGQKLYGPHQCHECGMIYQMGEAEDEKQHIAFHNNLSTLRHVGWKNENVVGRFGYDYVMVITGDDPRSWQQKAIEVIALVDKALGITHKALSVMHNQKVFLYISDKRIVGCMVANPITRAYKMISSESDVDICSEEAYPARCGVSRMWTLYSHRRHGIASKLLDTVRRNFMYGCIMPVEDVAFSVPTPDGKQFATKYTGSPNFLVYVGY